MFHLSLLLKEVLGKVLFCVDSWLLYHPQCLSGFGRIVQYLKQLTLYQPWSLAQIVFCK